MFSRFAKQMSSQFVGLGKSLKITSDGRTSHRIVTALICTGSESSGLERNPSEEQNAECLKASTALADTWSPGPSQAVAQDCGREPVPAERSTPPVGDVDIDGRKRQMLQQMEALQIASQLKILLEKQEAEQKMKLDQKKLDSDLEEQRIQDLTAALSQYRAFEEQERAQQTTPADSKSKEEEESSWSSSSLPYIAAGAVIGAVAAPAALTAAGFTAGGITAGSLGAAMMSATAAAAGGGVPAGSAVAILQSVGATTGGAYVSAAVGGAAGYVYDKVTGKSDKKEKKSAE